MFFRAPERLPRGRHSIAPELVRDAQKERLLAATTELLASRGYRGFVVGDVAKRAGVSLGVFYDCFSGKDDGIFQGYDRFIEVLLQRMIAVDPEGDDRAELVTNLIDAYFETLAGDLVVARAYQVEIDALGQPARERRKQSLTLFAEHIRQRDLGFQAQEGEQSELPFSAYLGVIYAARQLASDALDEDQPDLAPLSLEFKEWMADVFRVR